MRPESASLEDTVAILQASVDDLCEREGERATTVRGHALAVCEFATTMSETIDVLIKSLEQLRHQARSVAFRLGQA